MFEAFLAFGLRFASSSSDDEIKNLTVSTGKPNY
jgi:hypothetical protein